MTATHPPRIVVVGGGVGGLEALLALRDAAGDVVDIDLVAPERHFTYRAMGVAEPFGHARARTLDLGVVCRRLRVRRHLDSVASVHLAARRVRLRDGGTLRADALILAPGARSRVWREDAVTFGGVAGRDGFRDLLRGIEDGGVGSVAFVAPPGAAWTLPLYELALLTAGWCADNHVAGLQLTVVTDEPEPLAAFGPAASGILRDLLGDRGIRWSSREPAADAVVTMPALDPPAIPGLPDGFLAIDDRCRVAGAAPPVYAVGDATDHPVKQGGLAAQMADVAAAGVAHDLGLGPAPAPFEPVLRGLLLTGVAPAYLRGGDDPAAAFEALWWPPTKVAGRLLGPLLGGEAVGSDPEPLEDRPPAGGALRAREDRREIAIAMARSDAASGDYRSALRWLQTLEWLDGTLGHELDSLRRRWRSDALAASS